MPEELPNLMGQLAFSGSWIDPRPFNQYYTGGSVANGVFSSSANFPTRFTGTHTENSTANTGVLFSASNSNFIYGGSHVTPLSLTYIPLIKY